MRMDVIEQYNDKCARVWFENERWFVQIVNPKWFGKWINVKTILIQYRVDSGNYMVVELE